VVVSQRWILRSPNPEASSRPSAENATDRPSLAGAGRCCGCRNSPTRPLLHPNRTRNSVRLESATRDRLGKDGTAVDKLRPASTGRGAIPYPRFTPTTRGEVAPILREGSAQSAAGKLKEVRHRLIRTIPELHHNIGCRAATRTCGGCSSPRRPLPGQRRHRCCGEALDRFGSVGDEPLSVSGRRTEHFLLAGWALLRREWLA